MTSIESRINPVVSIVLPVKDGAQFIGDAIKSILNQSFTDFELIVIDDGSLDETVQIVSSFHDPRIQLISQENQGVSRASNRGFAIAKGKYITRHDHDDISLPTRLEKQIHFLETHPECGMVGTWANIWTSNTPTGYGHRHPTQAGEIAFELLFNAPFVNASCLFRREVLEWSKGYTEDDSRMPPEDYELFSRISTQWDLANIPENLMIYREVPNSQSSAIRSADLLKKDIFVSHLVLFSGENLIRALGSAQTSSEEEMKNAHNFGCLVHGCFEKLQEPVNIEAIKAMLIYAAQALVIRFRDPAILKTLKHKILFLEYQYHTCMGNTLHRSRLKYLYLNRSWSDNWKSVRKLLEKVR